MADIMKQFIRHMDGMAKFNVANAAAKAMAEHCDKRIEKKDREVARLRKALQKIADLPLRETRTSDKPPLQGRARRIAVAALTSNTR